MTIELILAASQQTSTYLGIGKDGKLPWNIPEDLKQFKEKTMGHTVIMGRKTKDSINKSLKGRHEIILSNNSKNNYMDLNSIEEYISGRKQSEKIFIIGGKVLFEKYITTADRIHLTLIKKKVECDTVLNCSIPNNFKLDSFSELKESEGIKYRFLEFIRTDILNPEFKYLNLMKEIIENGVIRSNRTGIDTISTFGAQLRFDISDSIPMITTKRTPFKYILEELLFFCRGETNSKVLENKGINIWKGNTSREFLDNRNLNSYPEGEMGPMYGHCFRNFGGIYPDKEGGFDQLAHVENLLKTDPFSRRIYITNLNPAQSKDMCLEPCHTFIQFYVSNNKELSAYFTMRSSDSLAWSYNIISYTILTYILAKKCDLKPKEIIYNSVDCHIYANHLEGIKEQLTREPRPNPKLQVSDSVKNKDWDEISSEDIELIGYLSSSSIKMDMAI